jgi:CheY-like chemotaxis protein
MAPKAPLEACDVPLGVPRDQVLMGEKQGRALVLVVDDDHQIRACTEQLLSDEGYAVSTAPDGDEALEVLESMARSGAGAPDVIVLDMQMPRTDGWSFARAHRERQLPRAPIIVLTAENAAQRAAEIGADAALSKPFMAAELLALVNAFVRPYAS